MLISLSEKKTKVENKSIHLGLHNRNICFSTYFSSSYSIARNFGKLLSFFLHRVVVNEGLCFLLNFSLLEHLLIGYLGKEDSNDRVNVNFY